VAIPEALAGGVVTGREAASSALDGGIRVFAQGAR
jgi:hypothetical protein